MADTEKMSELELIALNESLQKSLDLWNTEYQYNKVVGRKHFEIKHDARNHFIDIVKTHLESKQNVLDLNLEIMESSVNEKELVGFLEKVTPEPGFHIINVKSLDEGEKSKTLPKILFPLADTDVMWVSGTGNKAFMIRPDDIVSIKFTMPS